MENLKKKKFLLMQIPHSLLWVIIISNTAHLWILDKQQQTGPISFSFNQPISFSFGTTTTQTKSSAQGVFESGGTKVEAQQTKEETQQAKVETHQTGSM